MVKPWKKSFGKAIALAFVAEYEIEVEAGITGTTAELACLKMHLPSIVPKIHSGFCPSLLSYLRLLLGPHQ